MLIPRKKETKVKKLTFIAGLLFAIGSNPAHAAAGDTTWVDAHQNVWLDMYGNFDTTVQFPDGTVSYRKIQMTFTLGKYVCPGSPQYCSDWDYTVQLFVMTPSGDTLEIGRMITPYGKGPRMPADWKTDYIFDVTDYYPVLKDQATIRLFFSGYSGGFTGSLRFAFVEGTRTMDVLGIERLWDGAFDYGNSADPIDNSIVARTVMPPPGTARTALKVNVTGHGNDDANCSEFCQKKYSVVVDGSAVAHQTIWRDDCGFNFLYPQSGTWIYNRGNWCPGDLVHSNVHYLSGINPGTPVSVDVDFDPHTSTASQPGRSPAVYIFSSALFFYGSLNKNLDVSIEEILAPTEEDRHFRENRMCGSPVIRVRNTGQTPVAAIRFSYGVNGTMEEYIWQGALASLEETNIPFPELAALQTVAGKSESQQFTVRIIEVNGNIDADTSNNEMTTTFKPVPKWSDNFIVSMKTNWATMGGFSQSSWAIYNMDGDVVTERKNLHQNTAYMDTVYLTPGCYKLEVKDAGCDGLSWWATPAAGNGSVSVRPVSSAVQYALRGYFGGDFGCGFTQYFSVNWPTEVEKVGLNDKMKMELYPNPADNVVHIAISGATEVAGSIHVLDVTGRVVHRASCSAPLASINTSSFASGMYTIVYAPDRFDEGRLQGRFIVKKE
jgi:hypothetical protein